VETEEELTTMLNEPAEFISGYGFRNGPESLGSDDLDDPADLPRDGMTENESNDHELSETNPNEWDFAKDGDEGM
jgi:hypothetical protein